VANAFWLGALGVLLACLEEPPDKGEPRQASAQIEQLSFIKA
jgi:putative copper export protein